MASDWVEITHTASKDEPPAVVTREAYEHAWKDKGWKLHGEAVAPVGEQRPAEDEAKTEATK